MVTKRIPSFRKQRRKGGADRAFVELDGRRQYLGRYADPASKQRYHQLIAKWLATGRQPLEKPADLTITELCARFTQHPEEDDRKPDSSCTSEVSCAQAPQGQWR